VFLVAGQSWLDRHKAGTWPSLAQTPCQPTESSKSKLIAVACGHELTSCDTSLRFPRRAISHHLINDLTIYIHQRDIRACPDLSQQVWCAKQQSPARASHTTPTTVNPMPTIVIPA
jgi:hypothetical protein